MPLRALTQVTSGLCRNSSTSCDTVTSMLSRGRAAQSGSGSRRRRRRARETKAGREPTVRGCGPARPGRARRWGRGGRGRDDAVPSSVSCSVARCPAQPSGEEPHGAGSAWGAGGSGDGSGAGPQHVAARVRGQVQPARADLGPGGRGSAALASGSRVCAPVRLLCRRPGFSPFLEGPLGCWRCGRPHASASLLRPYPPSTLAHRAGRRARPGRSAQRQL